MATAAAAAASSPNNSCFPCKMSTPSKDSLRFQRRWNPPLLGYLPANFLRIEPDENQRKIATAYSRSRAAEMGMLSSALLQQVC